MNTNLHASRSASLATMQKYGWRRETIALLAVFLLSIALQLVFLVGISIYDSSAYSVRCRHIADGTHTLNQDLYCTRPLLIFPTGLIFRLAGVSELTAATYPMVCSLGILALTYLIGRRLYGSRVGLLATLLLAVCPTYVVTSTMLMPDVPVAFYMTLSVYLFLLGDSSLSKWRWLLFMSAGLALGAAYLVKMNGVILLLFYGAFFLVYRRKLSKLHWLVFVGAALVFFVETGVYVWLTGDPLFRIGGSLSLLAETRVGPPPFDYTLGCLPWNMFISINEFGLLFYLLIGALGYSVVKRKRELAILAIWFLTVYLYTHFGTWSLSTWRIGAQNCRYLIPVLIPACLLVAFWLVNTMRDRRRRLYHVVLGVVVSSSFAFTCITYAMEIEYRNGPKWAWQWLKDHRPLPVYSGVHPCRLMSFYSAGCPSYRAKLVRYYDYNPIHLGKVDLSKVSECYVVLDQLTIREVDKAHVRKVLSELGPPPPEIESPPAHWRLVASEKPGAPGLAGLALKAVDQILALPICPKQILGRRVADITDALNGDRVTIYYVPSKPESIGHVGTGDLSTN